MGFWLSVLSAFGLLLSSLFTGAHAGDGDSAISLAERVRPGGLVIGQAPPKSAVTIDGRAVRVGGDGHFVFGVGRDDRGSVEVVIEPPQGDRILRSVGIGQREYQIQRIDGLPPRKVEPNKDDQARIEADWIMLNDAKGTDSAADGFTAPAVWPAVGRISGVFGSQRILNGKPKSPHRGVDVAAPVGTPVGSMWEGVVTVAAPDLYYTGGTVMVDHGHGVKSLYAHLSSVDVAVGQRLSQGEPLGRIGSTGRSTGPHLHLSLYWFETALDPALMLGPMPRIETQ